MTLLANVRKETTGMLAKLGLRTDDMIAANFRVHGAGMGFHDLDDFRSYASRIYREAEKNPDGFTVIDLPKGKKAIDFQGKIRGVYDEFGEPLAFFRPEPKALGYEDPAQELKEFAQSIRFAS
jgi:hypothetical protein